MSQQTPNCPHWALKPLATLKQIEIQNGHLSEDEKWHTTDVEKLASSLDPQDLGQDSEALFADIARKMHASGMNSQQIADIINQHMTPDKKLKYCNAEEVNDCLA